MKLLIVQVEANKKSCGKCEFLQKVRDSGDPWWRCDLFEGEFLGYVSTGKASRTPSRAQKCLQAEAGSPVYYRYGPPTPERKVRIRDTVGQ